MAPKSAPFKVVIHFSGKKSPAEIQNLYADFYINAVKNTLTNSNLTEDGKRDVVDRLLTHFGKTTQET